MISTLIQRIPFRVSILIVLFFITLVLSLSLLFASDTFHLGRSGILNPNGVACTPAADPNGVVCSPRADPNSLAGSPGVDPNGLAAGGTLDPSGLACGTQTDPNGQPCQQRTGRL